jgi:PhnB protein
MMSPPPQSRARPGKADPTPSQRGQGRTKPDEVESVYTRLTVRDAVEAIDWYGKVFGTQVLYQSNNPDGRVFHSLLSIGDHKIIVTDEFPETNTIAPTTLGFPMNGLHLYVKDADAVAARAFAAGAEPAQRSAEDHFEISPEEDPAALADPSEVHPTFWGARFVMIIDPFGWRHEIATPTEMRTIGAVSDAIPEAQEIEESVRRRERGFFLRGRKKLTPENARRRADEWHARHPNYNRPNVPPRLPSPEWRPDVPPPPEPPAGEEQ